MTAGTSLAAGDPDEPFVSASPANPGAPLLDDVAVVYAKELHVLHKGAPNDSAPTVIPLPRPVVKAPVWSPDGRLFLALGGGDVAVLEGGALRVLAIPKELRKMKRPPRGARARRGWEWSQSDSLVRSADGAVAMWRCQWAEDRDGLCAGFVAFRLDGGEITRIDPRSPVDGRWPTIQPSRGYRAEIRRGDYRARATCTVPGAKTTGLTSGLGSVVARATIWVTRQPARLLVRYAFTRYVNREALRGTSYATSDFELVWYGEALVLWTDCDHPERAQASRGSGGLYAFGVASGWTLAYDGLAIRDFPGAQWIALAGP